MRIRKSSYNELADCSSWQEMSGAEYEYGNANQWSDNGLNDVLKTGSQASAIKTSWMTAMGCMAS